MNFDWRDWWKSFEHVLFPELCHACNMLLFEGEEFICASCRMTLPYTHDQYHPHPPVEKVFAGRVPIKAASAYLQFRKKGPVQSMLHHLKYRGHHELGTLLGKMHAHQMLEKQVFNEIDICIPVPLHPKKLKSRGYNQAEAIAQGIAEVMNLPCESQSLQRATHTKSQTKKGKYARYENMREVFEVADPAKFYGKHVLLVDDVVTTGATLESCAHLLLENGAAGVSIACIAYAEKGL